MLGTYLALPDSHPHFLWGGGMGSQALRLQGGRPQLKVTEQEVAEQRRT